MSAAPEATLVEKPLITYLREALGYEHLPPPSAMQLRGGQNQVMLLDHLVDALTRLNDIAQGEARAIASDLARVTDNQKWLANLRGGYSRKLAGEATHRPIKLIDFEEPENNQFVVTNQLGVQGLSFRKPDVVVYVNGIPLAIIEAKSAIGRQDVFDAIEDIRVYERELPRLFQTNLFNIATNGTALRYGPTGAPREFWSVWQDPWPRPASDFAAEPMRQGLWALLDKERLLDLLAHFVVFETDESSGTTIKKMCRYQQYRAVNKLVDRVVKGEPRRGLIWHTQGSGKSLTMVFAALKLKFHQGITAPALQNPNILVVTDRRDLDLQITRTFQACGVPNPVHASSIEDLQTLIRGESKGKVILSTIFKAYGSIEPVTNGDDWILLVDEAHRTQEKDLGAYLNATFAGARVFGFTGTPVKSKDLDTRRNFGTTGEEYLDRYGIEDAVADGATVPIRYISRMSLWDLDGPKLDVQFDQTFAGLPEELQNDLRARGVTRGDLARFEPRMALIAYDIWVHFGRHVQPDGLKAQIVAVDRKACTVYKRHLDDIIATDLMRQGMDIDEARVLARDMSVCIYSSAGKDDLKEGSEDLARFQLDEEAEKEAIRRFKDPDDRLSFLIVCNKLLTGFDAPIEQAMYLDSPLTQHNLLQAIARTNRRYGAIKDHGIIVDYIGVTKDLRKALSSYNWSDVEDAADSDSALEDELAETHAGAMAFLASAERSLDPEQDAKLGVEAIGSEDIWYQFRAAAAAFLRAYAAIGPRPARFGYKDDVLYVSSVIAYGRLVYENEPQLDWKEYSAKVRDMLQEHLQVTGLKTLLTLPSVSDPGFWLGLNAADDDGDLQTAALKKASALKKELRDRAARNPAQYESLSQRVEELIQDFQQRQIDAAELYRKTYELAVALVREEVAYEQIGLDRETHGFYAILSQDLPPAGNVDVCRFSEKSMSRIIMDLSCWRHERCAPSAIPFELGAGDAARGGAVVELLEEVASAAMPGFVGDSQGDAYAELHERVVRAPDRIIRDKDLDSPDLGPWFAWVFLGVEPLLFKVMALLEPARLQTILDKPLGLGGLVIEFQKADRIPYDLKLSSAEFETLAGWPERSAYNNAVRDVMGVRIDEAHKAPKYERRLWRSALVMMLGVIQQNEADLRSALAKQDAPAALGAERKRGEDLSEDLSEAENVRRAAALQLAELHLDETTAPVNWHLNPAVKKDLRRKAKRILMTLFSDKAQREQALDAVMDYAIRHYARARDAA